MTPCCINKIWSRRAGIITFSVGVFWIIVGFHESFASVFSLAPFGTKFESPIAIQKNSVGDVSEHLQGAFLCENCLGVLPDQILPISESFQSSAPHQSSENPQSYSSDEQAYGEPSGPPIWRIPTALIIGIGANPIMVLGLIIYDRRRWRWLSRILCICAALMFTGGLLLMYCLCVPGTWGWWV